MKAHEGAEALAQRFKQNWGGETIYTEAQEIAGICAIYLILSKRKGLLPSQLPRVKYPVQMIQTDW